jgi:hypothetical protein
MSKPLLELGDNLSWNRFYGANHQAVIKEDGSFDPIPRQSALCQGNIIAVGAISNVAKPHWHTGAWFELGISQSASSTSQVVAGMYFGRGKATLNTLALYHFPAYEPKPYLCLFAIPRWLSQVYLEGWWYDGTESDTTEQAITSLQTAMNGLETRLITIETKIDQL